MPWVPSTVLCRGRWHREPANVELTHKRRRRAVGVNKGINKVTGRDREGKGQEQGLEWEMQMGGCGQSRASVKTKLLGAG